MTARRYRKKPVVVEAAGPITVDNVADIARWADADYWGPESPMPAIFVETLEGEMRADLGDWIIRGVQGEFYPCKPDIFAATYEPAEDDQ